MSNDTNMFGVECPQEHRHYISGSMIEVVAGVEGYQCPDCDHVVDAMNASRRFGKTDQ